VNPPPLEPLSDTETVEELVRTNASPLGFVVALARVSRGHNYLLRISLWNPTLKRWLRLDLHPDLARALRELLQTADY
jgi:hypothetical protein